MLPFIQHVCAHPLNIRTDILPLFEDCHMDNQKEMLKFSLEQLSSLDVDHVDVDWIYVTSWTSSAIIPLLWL
jgi:hypothetical protein